MSMGFNYKKYLIIRAIWVVASLVLVRLFRRNRYYLQQLYWALGLLVFFILLLVFFVFFKSIG